MGLDRSEKEHFALNLKSPKNRENREKTVKNREISWFLGLPRGESKMAPEMLKLAKFSCTQLGLEACATWKGLTIQALGACRPSEKLLDESLKHGFAWFCMAHCRPNLACLDSSGLKNFWGWLV